MNLREKERKRKKEEEEAKEKRKEKENKINTLIQEKNKIFEIPKHLDLDKSKNRRDFEEKTNWVTGLAEIPISIEYLFFH